MADFPKIYRTYPLGNEIEEITPLEDPRNKFGRLVWNVGGCRYTTTGAAEGEDWHATRALACVRHMHNLKSRMRACADEHAKLTDILISYASENEV